MVDADYELLSGAEPPRRAARTGALGSRRSSSAVAAAVADTARARRAALVTGITGQDGSFLAELLLEQGLSRHRDCPAPRR